MNIQAAINQAVELLQQKTDRTSARIDAEYLLSKVLNQSFTWLKTWPEYQLTPAQQTLFFEMLKRRQSGEPIAYIIGEKAFWSLELNTNSSTLIPRPETELLVEKSLEFLADKQSATILDLGTGTGAIALSIASERKADQVYACDFNLDAVVLARQNAVKNNINNVELFQSDWFSNVHLSSFDLIVSNPPYIEVDDPHLKQGDLIFEPRSALVSGEDGLVDIRLIVTQAKNYLTPAGCLILEHGFEQAKAVRQIFTDKGYVKVQTIVDLAGLERATLGLSYEVLKC